MRCITIVLIIFCFLVALVSFFLFLDGYHWVNLIPVGTNICCGVIWSRIYYLSRREGLY